MDDFLQRLKQRKLVQWAVAYLAAAWVLLQVLDLATGSYHWPDAVMHIAFGVLAVGFVVVLVLAWYHGERGAQRVSGVELLIVALVLVVGGGVLWNFSRTSGQTGATNEVAATPTTSAVGAHAPGAAANTPIRVPAAATSAMTLAASSIAAQPIPAKSVAVLPFENLSTDKSNAYFADGMQDLILTKIADIGDLKVISRTSTEQYGSRPGNLTKIGEQLGVATILEGSVQKAGNQVLINVQLIDAKTDSHIWAQDYTRTLDNIFGVEGEVADKVANALNAKLTAKQSSVVASVPTHSPEAYDDYLRALHFEHEANKGAWAAELPKAIAAYEKAVKEDPDFALAWAGLSEVRIDARFWGVDYSHHNLRAADAAAKRALALAPNLPDAHLAMASVQRFYYRNIEAAHAQAQQAVQLRPNDPDALDTVAILDSHLGNFDAAIRTLERVTMLEPMVDAPDYQLGILRGLIGDYPGAERVLTRALVINPQDAEVYAMLSHVVFLSNGDVEAASHVLDNVAPGTPMSLNLLGQRVRLLLYRRDFTGARKLLGKFAKQFDSGIGPTWIAQELADIEWLSGNLDAARAHYRTVIGWSKKPGVDLSPAYLRALSLAYARLGNADDAIKNLDAAAVIDRQSHDVAGPAMLGGLLVPAEVQLALGNTTQAINAIDRAMANPAHGSVSVWLLKLDPTWDPIRHNPRFQALLKKYGQPEPATASATASTATAPGATRQN